MIPILVRTFGNDTHPTSPAAVRAESVAAVVFTGAVLYKDGSVCCPANARVCLSSGDCFTTEDPASIARLRALAGLDSPTSDAADVFDPAEAERMIREGK